MRAPSLVDYAAPFTAACLWGAAFTAGKFVVFDVHPLSAAAVRFIIAGIVLYAWVSLRDGPLSFRLGWRDWSILFMVGFTESVLATILYFYGLQLSTALNLSLANAGQSGLTALFAAIFLREVVNLRQVAGIGLSIVGLVYIVAGGSLERLVRLDLNLGDLLFVATVASWSMAAVFIRLASKSYSSSAIVAYQSIISGAVLAALAIPFMTLDEWLRMPASAWVALLYLAVPASALALILWTEGIQRIGVTRASAFGNMMPIAGAITAWLILDETLTVHHFVGAALVFLGVYLTAGKARTKPAR